MTDRRYQPHAKHTQKKLDNPCDLDLKRKANVVCCCGSPNQGVVICDVGASFTEVSVRVPVPVRVFFKSSNFVFRRTCCACINQSCSQSSSGNALWPSLCVRTSSCCCIAFGHKLLTVFRAENKRLRSWYVKRAFVRIINFSLENETWWTCKLLSGESVKFLEDIFVTWMSGTRVLLVIFCHPALSRDKVRMLDTAQNLPGVGRGLWSLNSNHVIAFSDLVDLWVIKIKKPMILCAPSTWKSREQSMKRPYHTARVRERFFFSIVKITRCMIIKHDRHSRAAQRFVGFFFLIVLFGFWLAEQANSGHVENDEHRYTINLVIVKLSTRSQ